MFFTLFCLPYGNLVAEEQLNHDAQTSLKMQEVLQNKLRIIGQVVDVSGEPIIGASVVEKGTTNGIITDLNGHFSLNISPESKLQISFVGFKNQEIIVGSKRDFKIILQEDAEILDEVVVVGYGSVKKSDLTGAVSSVSTKELIRSGKTDAVGAMQGVMPGVQIQHANSKPGGEYNILIRGLNTISGSTSPLVVIDGVPGASLSNINPDDIEKIDILKDASSTAIYGSRATNGVVMVTTKKGQLGKVKIDYSGYTGIRNYTNLPDMMSGPEYVQLAREAKRAANNNVYVDDSSIFTPSELKAIADNNYFNWLDAISSTAFMTNHTISATGGTEAASYALSAGYYYEDGMLEPQEYSRYNLRAVVDVKPSKYMKFGINMYGTHSVRDTGNSDLLQDAFRLRPTYHPTDLVTGEEVWSYSNGQYNALTTMKNELNKTKEYNLLSNIYLSISPIKGMEIKTTFSPNITINEIGQYRGKYTKANKGQNAATSNYAKNSYVDWVWDNLINYNITKKNHRLDLTGVFSMQQSQDETLKGIGNGLSYNSLWYNLSGGANSNASSSGFTKTDLMSYLVRANYVYKDKYLFTASIRFDGSSKLAEGNKWASFPSASVAWRLSEEEFMKNDWLSNMKLRVSYGKTGNDNVSAYQTEGSISGAKYYTFGSTDVIGYTPNNLRNFDLGWESTTEYNIGIDYGFFNNRISGDIEYYNRLTEDLIMNKTVPVTTGYSSVKANVGSVRNQGIEFSLNAQNIQNKDFSWRTNFNFAYNKNKIVDLQYKEDLTSRGESMNGMFGDYSNLWVIGQPIDINYNLITVGVWQSDEAEAAAAYGCKPGQFKVLDLNKDGTIDDKDRVISGKRTPDWNGGMTNTLTYKNFDLSFQAIFQAGAKVRNQFFVQYALENNNLNFNNLRKNYWTPENPSNSMAQPNNMGPYRDLAGSWGNTKAGMSHTFSSTDYLKISYITFGYTLRRSLLDRMNLGNLRLYATVQNPFIFCADNVYDPEQISTSINSTDAMTCNIIFGVNLSFK
ncbi:TonB-dependent receptor [uncultured Bacteroides sp.]|uniref:SusC/RagA family TonB-linked outer membrane protein n=1 Tax=uncultured Bacteroides sp. TaxID=162156 RepID=UPI002AA69814|nr:TonB-dependent receptor [uncultured Bacteroides sp.]